ncbi:MAG: hypothetical protein ABW133_05640 [Polyangiaceae bacterium]
MSSRRRMMGMTLAATAFALYLGGCEDEKKEEAKPAATASAPPPVVSAPPAASPAPVASTPEKVPSHPCPDKSTGKGTFDDPCKAKGKTRLMDVTWDKKIGDKGPTFKIVNNAKLDILYGKVVVYFYDKAGKQLEAKVGDKNYKRLTCAGNIFAGAVKPAEKVFMNFSCVRKDDVPAGATTIEGEIQTIGFTDDAGKSDTYWRNDDLAPEERPKGGIKG